jgi:hypothetical protein
LAKQEAENESGKAQIAKDNFWILNDYKEQTKWEVDPNPNGVVQSIAEEINCVKSENERLFMKLLVVELDKDLLTYRPSTFQAELQTVKFKIKALMKFE